MKLIVLLIAMLTVMNSWRPDHQEAKKESTLLFSFGVIADAQYCDCDPAGSRYYRNSLQKLDDAMMTIEAEEPEFILHLGDFIDRDFESYIPMIDILKKYKTPVLHCLGNHDYSVDRELIKKIPVLLKGSDGYYSHVYHGYRFIILNGNEVSVYGPGTKNERDEAGKLLEQMRSEGKPNATPWNGGLSAKQMKWFEAELEKSKKTGEKVFIVCHFPVWSTDAHVLLNQEEVLALLSRYDNIIAWFAGHAHQGGYGNYNLIHCLTFKGMVETADENSYAIVDVYKNKIWIRGFGREKSRILAY